MSAREVSDVSASSRDDEALARRAAARDPQAWSELFELHYTAVFAFVRYRLYGSDIAEDLAAQTFETAYSIADRFDWKGVPIQAWLIGIARNLCRDHIKKVARRGTDSVLDETFTAPAPDEISGIDLRNDLVAAMRHLTEDQRDVLHHRFILDRSVAETAALMDRSEDAVKTLQRRALAAMARAMTPLPKGGPPR